MDEVTATEGEWAAQIKWLRDNDDEFAEATVVLAGSSAAGLSAAAGVLAGRRGRATDLDRTLMPMGFRTFAALWHPAVTELPTLGLYELHSGAGAAGYAAALPWLNDLVRLWEVYLRYGGSRPPSPPRRQANQFRPGSSTTCSTSSRGTRSNRAIWPAGRPPACSPGYGSPPLRR